MQVTSAPFVVEKTDDGLELIGYGADERDAFFRMIHTAAKHGKMYQMKLVEVKAAEAQRNYMYLCLSMMADECGRSSASLLAEYRNMVRLIALDDDNDFMSKDTWLEPIINSETGEVEGYEVVGISSFTPSMMTDFIDLFQAHFRRMYENFVFPDPKMYKGVIKGAKNQLKNSNVKSTIKLKK